MAFSALLSLMATLCPSYPGVPRPRGGGGRVLAAEDVQPQHGAAGSAVPLLQPRQPPHPAPGAVPSVLTPQNVSSEGEQGVSGYHQLGLYMEDSKKK